MKTSCLIPLAVLILSLAAIGTLPAENPQFRERLAAWQSPQGDPHVRPANFQQEARSPARQERFVEESVGDWIADATGGGYGPCNDECGSRGPCCRNWDWCTNTGRPRLSWIGYEGLLFWRKGRDLPPLVTTGDAPVPPPGDTVLFGDRTETSAAKGGGRLEIGTWFTCDEFVGIGGRFWGLATERSTFSLSSADLPAQTIERPFLEASGTLNSLVVADPFTGFGGNIRIVSSSEVIGADVFVRIRCAQSCFSRTDFVTGYQFSRINESLLIHSDTQGGTLIVDDNYATTNEFHGAILGVLHDADCGCITLQLAARVALGNISQTATASGQTNSAAGGLLVEADATQVQETFCAVPEVGITLRYRISPCTEIHAGYTFLYWSNVARPENLIDNVRGDDISLVLRDSSFWVQGFRSGLTYSW